MTISGHPLKDFVAVIERGGHQVWRLIGGIAKHDPLIASAFILVARRVYALRDMGGLAVKIVEESQRLPVETILLIADFLNRIAHGRFDFFLRTSDPFTVFIHALAADFTGQNN